jgi:DNA-binding beta-propeller fold protein YncE
MVSIVGLSALVAGCASGSPGGRLAGRPLPPLIGPAAVASHGAPGCTTATKSALALPGSATAMMPAPAQSNPFGVAVTADGRWGFASWGTSLAVLRLSTGHAPTLVRTISLPQAGVGVALSLDDRLLLIAAGSAGAVVVSVPAAEEGSQQAVLGTLTSPIGSGAIEVAVSRDGRYAFVSMETSDQIAVFNLAKAVAAQFGTGTYVGSIPTQVAPVGLAVSPDGRWLYSTSEGQTATDQDGTVAVISVARAEHDPPGAVIDRVTAGCQPVRVTTSADGRVVWVTARASDALLAFSASRLRSDPARALLADVAVGEAPVGLALARHGSLIIVADSNRFSAAGQTASLAVVDVADALASKPALLGYLPAGRFPRDVASDPDGGTVLVANYASNQLETVSVAALP